MAEKYPSGVTEYPLIRYQIVLQSRYAAERAYHIVKSDKDFKDLFSFVQLDAQEKAGYYSQVDKSYKREHHQFVSPSVLVLSFKKQNQFEVVRMLQKHGRDLYHVHANNHKHTRIDAVRSQVNVLFMDFTQ